MLISDPCNVILFAKSEDISSFPISDECENIDSSILSNCLSKVVNILCAEKQTKSIYSDNTVVSEVIAN